MNLRCLLCITLSGVLFNFPEMAPVKVFIFGLGRAFDIISGHCQVKEIGVI